MIRISLELCIAGPGSRDGQLSVLFLPTMGQTFEFFEATCGIVRVHRLDFGLPPKESIELSFPESSGRSKPSFPVIV
jgi:hypothetical protein